jgi:hypothetical protein
MRCHSLASCTFQLSMKHSTRSSMLSASPVTSSYPYRYHCHLPFSLCIIYRLTAQIRQLCTRTGSEGEMVLHELETLFRRWTRGSWSSWRTGSCQFWHRCYRARGNCWKTCRVGASLLPWLNSAFPALGLLSPISTKPLLLVRLYMGNQAK